MNNEMATPGRENIIGQKKIFKPSSWVASINFINHLVLFNNVVMAILADPNNGKSTFADLIQLGMDPNIDSFLIKTTTEQFSKPDLLNQLTLFSALKQDESFSDFTKRINDNKKPSLIIIDDAHCLDDDCLIDIFTEIKNFPEINFFHVCLIGDNSLLAKLKEFERTYLQDRIHAVKLGNLTESETKTYLLKNLPLCESKKITDENLEKFYLLTEGNIARVNSQMMHFFNKPTNKLMKFKQYSLVASGLFALTSAAYYLQNSTELNFITPTQVLVNKEALPLVKHLNLASQIPPLTVAAVIEPMQPPPLKRVVSLQDDEEALSMVVMDKVVAVPKSLNKHLVNAEPFLPSDLMSINELEKKQAEIKQQKGIIHEEDLKSEEDIIAEDVSNDGEHLSKKNYLEKNVLVNVSDKGNFTIQLMASPNKQDLNRFSKLWGIKDHVRLGKVNREGVNWYILTLGNYEQRQQAVYALEKLPENLSKFKPWIRSVHGVKALG